MSDVEIRGDDWFTYPRGWRDVIRCLFGRHQIVMWGTLNGSSVRRCSCAAINIDGLGWFESHWWERR